MAAVFWVDLARDHHKPSLCPAGAREAQLFDTLRKFLRDLLRSIRGEALSLFSGVACEQRVAQVGYTFDPFVRWRTDTARYRHDDQSLQNPALCRRFMTKFPNRLTLFLVLLASSAFSYSQVTPVQTRGGLLYTTHCIACHTTQMHWRNDRQAYDWDSLKVQVRRWQGNAGLQWGEADITEVSRYLNDTIYRYATPADRVALISSYKFRLIQQTH